jgi:hypothetical protein
MDLSAIAELSDGRRLYPLRQAVVSAFVPGAPRAWQTKDGLRIIAGMEPYLDGRYGDLLHVSFSREHRLPGWKEVKIVKETFYGDELEAMLVLPQKKDYTNIHYFTHHLWQMPEAWSS